MLAIIYVCLIPIRGKNTLGKNSETNLVIFSKIGIFFFQNVHFFERKNAHFEGKNPNFREKDRFFPQFSGYFLQCRELSCL